MGRLQFLKDKKFYVNLLIILLLCISLLWLTFRLLDKYTRHDKVYTMPDFIGMDYHEVARQYAHDFHFFLIDSVYPKGQQPGSIYQQDPLPNSKIKKGRNVYIIIVAETPEKTVMPNLRNLSLRQAIGSLESAGLDVERLDYRESPYKNAILDQYYNGQPIAEGTELVKGSKIVLRVGIGRDKDRVKVPNLIGKPAVEAKRLLNLAGLNLGRESFEDNDSLQYLCIRRMNPGPSSNSVNLGTSVDLTYHSSRTLDFKKEMRELLHEDSLANVPKPIEIELDVDTITETIETTDIDYEDEF
jgi:beta-lactam-binding protein with PASTA domain